MEKQIGYDLDSLADPVEKNITVEELVERYLMMKTGVEAKYAGNLRPSFQMAVDVLYKISVWF